MSGGSYNYLHSAWDLETYERRESDLDAMANRLTELGHADAARETLEALYELRRARARLDALWGRMGAVWKAVEWYDSADWGPEQVDEALREYRGLGS